MKKISAFTIAELVFVFIFVGTVSIIAMHTANNRFTDYYSRYSTAMEFMSKAAYNIYADTYCRIKDGSTDDKADCTEEEMKNGRPFPNNHEEFRKRLAEYLNITQKSKDSIENSILSIASADDNEFKDSDADKNEFKNGEKHRSIQLILTNGFRLYFSDKKDIKINDETLNYYIVYVDLNGSAKPNRAKLHPDFYAGAGKKPSPSTVRPDIVPFVVTFKGDVIPVGFPVYDKSYITARVLSSNNDQSKSYTLDEARQLAYGNAEYTDIPLTMMPKFQENLPVGITTSKSDLKSIPKYNASEGIESYNCKEGTYNCQIKIDYNIEKRF